MSDKPKIGGRVYWQSLDPTISRSYGTITNHTGNGNRILVRWDDDEEREEVPYDLGPHSCIHLVKS